MRIPVNICRFFGFYLMCRAGIYGRVIRSFRAVPSETVKEQFYGAHRDGNRGPALFCPLTLGRLFALLHLGLVFIPAHFLHTVVALSATPITSIRNGYCRSAYICVSASSAVTRPGGYSHSQARNLN